MVIGKLVTNKSSCPSNFVFLPVFLCCTLQSSRGVSTGSARSVDPQHRLFFLAHIVWTTRLTHGRSAEYCWLACCAIHFASSVRYPESLRQSLGWLTLGVYMHLFSYAVGWMWAHCPLQCVCTSFFRSWLNVSTLSTSITSRSCVCGVAWSFEREAIVTFELQAITHCLSSRAYEQSRDG